MNPNEVKKGVAHAVDDYTNDPCCECGSDEIREIEEKDICPVCHMYHEEDDYISWGQCFDSLYNDFRGLIYIMTHWTMKYIIEIATEKSDEGRDDTIKEIISERGEEKDFVQYICEFDDNSKYPESEKRDDYVYSLVEKMARARKVVTIAGESYYEFIDTNAVVN
jgi:hypothetical protein